MESSSVIYHLKEEVVFPLILLDLGDGQMRPCKRAADHHQALVESIGSFTKYPCKGICAAFLYMSAYAWPPLVLGACATSQISLETIPDACQVGLEHTTSILLA